MATTINRLIHSHPPKRTDAPLGDVGCNRQQQRLLACEPVSVLGQEKMPKSFTLDSISLFSPRWQGFDSHGALTHARNSFKAESCPQMAPLRREVQIGLRSKDRGIRVPSKLPKSEQIAIEENNLADKLCSLPA